MTQQKKFHLLFSILMGAMMVLLITGFSALVNDGLTADFLSRWLKAFSIAYPVAVPAIFFLAPVARKLTGRLLDMPN